MDARVPVFFLITILFTSRIIAVQIQTHTSQTSLSSPDEQLSVGVTITGAKDGTNYLRGVFYKLGSSVYCGFTMNDTGAWYNGPIGGDGFKHFLPVQISSGSASIQLFSKIDTSYDLCNQSGDFLFKVIRYVGSDNGSDDDQIPLQLPIAIPSKTPTTVPSNTPAKTPTPTRTPVSTVTPSSRPQPSPTLTVKPIQIAEATSTPKTGPAKKPSPTVSPTEAESTASGDVLSAEVPVTPTVMVKAAEVSRTNRPAVVGLGVTGVGLTVLSVALGLKQKNKRHEQTY